MLLVILLGKWRQHLICPVTGTATILTGGHVGNDLRHLSHRNLNRVGRLNLGVPNGEAVIQHIVKINQATVGFRHERVIVKIMPMNVATQMRIGNSWRQHFQANRFSHRAGCQITLGREHPTILVGILIDDTFIAIDQPRNIVINVLLLFAR